MKKKLRILMLNYEFPPLGGGAGNATNYLLKEFSKNPNIEIDLITSSIDKFKIKDFSKNVTIHFLDINKKGNLHYQSNKDLLTYSKKAYNYSKTLIEKKSYDLCHAFFGIPCGYLAMKLNKKYDIPYIVSLRGSDVPFYNKRFHYLDKFLFKRLSKKIWKKSKATITNSEGLRQLAQSSAPNQKISVIYNGIDTNEFKPSRNKKTTKPIKIISTGRLIERKGYQYLIPALKDLNEIELSLVGDGNIKEELENLTKTNNANVKFLGKKSHEEIPKILSKADIDEKGGTALSVGYVTGKPILFLGTGQNYEDIEPFNVEKFVKKL
ncbi:MAG: glycosyltransferase family 4 protein, partial [Nanoarchaeota archaeon]|nr:glycosyltransferase family 4 protein [Nanoarchaeota archaeon]